MRNVKAVIFDKTGTLTEGKLQLSDIHVLDDSYSEEDVVKIAASLENNSSHPIAQAIVNYANSNEILFDEIEDFRNVPGKGIIGNVGGKQYYAANESLIEGSEFNISQEDINQYSVEGKTLIFIGDEKSVIASLTVVDKIRDNAQDVIKDLKEQGVKTIMLTGDNKLAANKVANEIGLDYVYSNLLPEDKLNILDTIRNKFGDVAMVGDGINDAPALARANIGIAMGALATALGAVQYALVKSQKPYAKGGQLDGGVAQGKRHRDGGIPVLGGRASIEGGEFITNRITTQNNVDVLDFINSRHKKLSLDDFINFYSSGKLKKNISSMSPRTAFADGGVIPTISNDIDINDRLLSAMEAYAERPVVVSVVDINNRQNAVKNVQVLAGLE